MAPFNPQKLHVTFDNRLAEQPTPFPRCYTLTHSDRTGDLFLTVSPSYDEKQISGWYTRLMRDEVLAEWEEGGPPSLHLHCHVSGGLALGPARWRASILRQHMPLVLKALCYGDRAFLAINPPFQNAPILVHFHAKQKALDTVEDWGKVQEVLASFSDD